MLLTLFFISFFCHCVVIHLKWHITWCDTSTKYSFDPTLSLFLTNFILNDRHFFIVIVVLCWLLLDTFKTLLWKPFHNIVLFVCSYVYSVRHCGLLWFDQSLCRLSIAQLHSLFPSKKNMWEFCLCYLTETTY